MSKPKQSASTRYIVGKDTILDTTTEVMWSKDLGVGDNHSEAEALIAKANADKLGGFDDWRLSTARESFGIVDHSRYAPACDPAFSDMKNDWYWTSTADASDKKSCAWAVDFDGGGVHLYYRDYRFRVRAVRSARQ